MTPIIPPSHAIHPLTGKPMRLGKKAVRRDPRTPRLSAYMSAELPTPPKFCDWTRGVADFGEMLNDQLGCCVIAAMGHAIQTWTLNTEKEITIPDSDVLDAYEKWAGYNPLDPSTDQGTVELSALNDWRQAGSSMLDEEQLSAFMTVQPGNLEHVKQTIAIFGGIFVGISLPVTAQSQVGTCWEVQPGAGEDALPGSWGGHGIWVPKYDGDDNVFTCITWGKPQPMTKEFWLTYVDESYGLVSPSWIESNGQTPSGFNLTQLLTDLKSVS